MSWRGEAASTWAMGPTEPLIFIVIQPPATLPGFPNASRTKGKTKTRSGLVRARWVDLDGFIYEWDYLHGRVEKYDKRGRHMGEFDPATGTQTKDPTNRRVEP